MVMMLEKEREYYEMMHATLNGNVPSRALDEYIIDKEKFQHIRTNITKIIKKRY
jgi:hypothetical protein